MRVLFYSFSLLFNLFIVISANEHNPVLLWTPNQDLPVVPSLKLIGSLEFNELLHDALGTSKPMVVVFLEENLSPEDFNLRSSIGKPLYDDLRSSIRDVSVEYLPSVVNPMKSIRHLEENGYERIRYHGKVPRDLTSPSVIVVSLPDDNSLERSEVLRAHFKKIHNIYREIVKEYPDLLAVYTGRRNAWAQAQKSNLRVVRDADSPDGTAEEGLLVMSARDVVILATGIEYKTDPAGEPTQLTSVVSADLTNGTEEGILMLNVKFTPTAELTFNLEANPDVWQWELISVTHEGKKLLPSIAIEAPSQWSWFCSNPVFFQSGNDSFILNITGLQVQPNMDPASFEFGQAIDCVPYFSIAIWTGIVIVLLMLFILSWGLTMLMDINNNDRFDDPKGKTITISATD